ncbi:hypothetical protein DL546_006851 [Coniochaeta pulveracea]|uniref:Uncharacterized protein n=1 Tax=Coniochaeta pulveracea TaxID=177199 RepID=A0A420YBN4_9PEZI|nr:hypothetical protein DL546_006851 [Coniochaeta pulveracea]
MHTILQGGMPMNNTGAELGAYCKPYFSLNDTAAPVYTVLNLADCIARYPPLGGPTGLAEHITNIVKACPTKNITLDPSTLSLTIGCDPLKRDHIDISEFVRSENGWLACYDVRGWAASPAEVAEIRGNQTVQLKRQKPYLHDWHNGPRVRI